MKGIGRGLALKILKFVAGAEIVAGFLVDWNRTHLFNPKWTPHAKFHDALSISMASMNGVLALYLLEKKSLSDPVKLAAMVLAVPCLAMGMAYAFPGAKGLEAEFPEVVPKVGKVYLSEWLVCVSGLSLIGLSFYFYNAPARRKYWNQKNWIA